MARKKTMPTMRVALHKVISETVYAEIPVECPKCGASFYDKEQLSEEQLVSAEQGCSIAKPADLPDGHGAIFTDDWGLSDYGDSIHVVGYRCRSCSTSLVSTEGAHQAGLG